MNKSGLVAFCLEFVLCCIHSNHWVKSRLRFSDPSLCCFQLACDSKKKKTNTVVSLCEINGSQQKLLKRTSVSYRFFFFCFLWNFNCRPWDLYAESLVKRCNHNGRKIDLQCYKNQYRISCFHNTKAFGKLNYVATIYRYKVLKSSNKFQ